MKNFYLTALFLFCMIITGFAQPAWILSNRVDEAVISTSLSKDSIQSIIRELYRSNDYADSKIDTIDLNVQSTKYYSRFLIPPLSINMVNKLMFTTELSFNTQYIIADGKLKIVISDYMAALPYKKVKLDSIKNGQIKSDYVLGFLLINVFGYDKYYDRINNPKRNIDAELKEVEIAEQNGELQFLTESEKFILLYNVYGLDIFKNWDKYTMARVKRANGLPMTDEEKNMTVELILQGSIWEKHIYNDFFLDPFKALAKGVSGNILSVGVDARTTMVNIDNQLVPTDEKERKSWYKANKIEKEKQKEIEAKITAQL